MDNPQTTTFIHNYTYSTQLQLHNYNIPWCKCTDIPTLISKCIY
jgi:hypothetical protein